MLTEVQSMSEAVLARYFWKMLETLKPTMPDSSASWDSSRKWRWALAAISLASTVFSISGVMSRMVARAPVTRPAVMIGLRAIWMWRLVDSNWPYEVIRLPPRTSDNSSLGGRSVEKSWLAARVSTKF